MNKLAVLSFGITTCVLVPTALHVIQAGPNQVAKLVAPDETSIQIGDAKVDVSVDRSLVEAGGKVRVTLTATSDKAVKVPLAVLVYEQEGMAEARTEAPPDRVGRDEVTLDVKDGKATKTFAFTLPGHQAEEMDGVAPFGHYTVLVMAPKAADKLEKMRRKTHNSGDDQGGFFGAYYQLGKDDSDFGKAGEIARLDVNTTSGSNHLAIVAGDTAVADSDIAVKVRVRNPSKKPYEQIKVSLSTRPSALDGEWKGIAAEQVAIDDNADAEGFALAGHETKILTFHVHTSEVGTLGLYASVSCSGGDCYDGRSERIDDSVLDAIDVLAAPDKPANEVAPATAEAAAVPASAQVAVQPTPAKPVLK